MTEDRDNFQGRSILNLPFEGESASAKGRTCVADTRKRIKDEAALSRPLMGWSATTIASNITRTVPKR